MIREIKLKDKELWKKLYKGYADFYKVEMNNKILQTVWNWLHDKNHEIEAKYIPNSFLKPVDSPFGHCAANPGNDKNFELQLDKNINELLNN